MCPELSVTNMPSDGASILCGKCVFDILGWKDG